MCAPHPPVCVFVCAERIWEGRSALHDCVYAPLVCAADTLSRILEVLREHPHGVKGAAIPALYATKYGSKLFVADPDGVPMKLKAFLNVPEVEMRLPPTHGGDVTFLLAANRDLRGAPRPRPSLEAVRENLSQLVQAHPEGLWSCKVPASYQDMFGETMPALPGPTGTKIGCEALLRSSPGVIGVPVTAQGNMKFFHVSNMKEGRPLAAPGRLRSPLPSASLTNLYASVPHCVRVWQVDGRRSSLPLGSLPRTPSTRKQKHCCAPWPRMKAARRCSLPCSALVANSFLPQMTSRLWAGRRRAQPALRTSVTTAGACPAGL